MVQHVLTLWMAVTVLMHEAIYVEVVDLLTHTPAYPIIRYKTHPS